MGIKQTSNYKERYYDERFNAMATLINGHMLLITEKLEKIETQTTKTNGRVTSLENFKQEAQRVIDTREVNCPVIEVIDKKIDNSLSQKYEDMHFVLRHPKLFIGAIVIMVILSLATLVENNPLKVFEKNKTESVK